MKFARDTQFGRLTGVAVDEATFEALVPTLLEAFVAPGRSARELELGSRRVWLKASALRGRARLRHGLRAKLLLRPAPREREFRALNWLRERIFQAPEPLVAGTLSRFGFPSFQFLATELVPDATPLDAALASAEPPARARWLAELARETARMHALHFVHRDLFLRNVLVAPSDVRELWFIDCWRGGDALPGRDAAWDLGCFFLEAASLCSVDEQRAFLARYVAERATQHAPVEPRGFVEHVERVRAAWLARVRREPGRWRQTTPPAPHWDGRALIG
ncbi:MAG: lipopolysaccharide kinase InaA family protein [Planctomycetes bacterium]|nr:lipopolysaccharide kinase InaA family protein [Planctomycetota bacterium]